MTALALRVVDGPRAVLLGARRRLVLGIHGRLAQVEASGREGAACRERRGRRGPTRSRGR